MSDPKDEPTEQPSDEDPEGLDRRTGTIDDDPEDRKTGTIRDEE